MKKYLFLVKFDMPSEEVNKALLMGPISHIEGRELQVLKSNKTVIFKVSYNGWLSYFLCRVHLRCLWFKSQGTGDTEGPLAATGSVEHFIPPPVGGNINIECLIGTFFRRSMVQRGNWNYSAPGSSGSIRNNLCWHVTNRYACVYVRIATNAAFLD